MSAKSSDRSSMNFFIQRLTNSPNTREVPSFMQGIQGVLSETLVIYPVAGIYGEIKWLAFSIRPTNLT